jgi:hypothetical protein
MNERTRNQQAGTAGGMMRKSGTSMKPAREVAGTVRAGSPTSKGRKKDPSLMTKEERKEQKRIDRDARDRAATVQTILRDQDPAYQQYRKVWWGLLGAGILLTVISWACMFVLPGASSSMTDPMGIAAIVSLVLAYAAIIGGFIFDLVKVRPIRRACEAQVAGMTDKKMQEIIDEAYMKELEKKAAKQAKKAAK